MLLKPVLTSTNHISQIAKTGTYTSRISPDSRSIVSTSCGPSHPSPTNCYRPFHPLPLLTPTNTKVTPSTGRIHKRTLTEYTNKRKQLFLRSNSPNVNQNPDLFRRMLRLRQDTRSNPIKFLYFPSFKRVSSTFWKRRRQLPFSSGFSIPKPPLTLDRS